MEDSVDSKVSEKSWEDIRGSLTSADTGTVTDQLQAMGEAEVIYKDGTVIEWEEDIEENYLEIFEAFGGDENLDQYMDVAGAGVTVAVEEDEEPLFVVYGKEEMYGGTKGLDLGVLGTYT